MKYLDLFKYLSRMKADSKVFRVKVYFDDNGKLRTLTIAGNARKTNDYARELVVLSF